MIEDFSIKEFDEKRRPKLTFVFERWKDGEIEKTEIVTNKYSLELVKPDPHRPPKVKVSVYDKRRNSRRFDTVDFELLDFLTKYIPLLKEE